MVRRFGNIPHPTFKGITLQSNGIQLATTPNSKAKSIFQGTVLAIQISRKGMKTVMIQHGNYISLYGNLASVSVKKGQNVKLHQNLGTIHTNKITGKTILKFQIWNNILKQNPQRWLLRL